MHVRGAGVGVGVRLRLRVRVRVRVRVRAGVGVRAGLRVTWRRVGARARCRRLARAWLG